MIAGVAQTGDCLATLEALRDRLAQEIDDCMSNRDLAALTLRLVDILQRIDNMPQSAPTSKADEIAARRAERLAQRG